MVETDEIYVVPHFISEGYFTPKVIPRELGLAGPIARRNGKIIKYCEPIGSHPRMTDLLLQQVTRIAPDIPLAQTVLWSLPMEPALMRIPPSSQKSWPRKSDSVISVARLAVCLEEEPLISDRPSLVSFP
jgi:sirohydrochlorin cobaltochelatase